MRTFEIGKHIVKLSENDRRWHADVDGASLPRWFLTEADAWTSAVHEALRLDQEQAALARG
ncbi:MAG: hypothetical protein HZB56_16230 [Deltaproteobacteria bacterium]|nr:hypothetical protein [Deltaproteobacteria bacterium]